MRRSRCNSVPGCLLIFNSLKTRSESTRHTPCAVPINTAHGVCLILYASVQRNSLFRSSEDGATSLVIQTSPIWGIPSPSTFSLRNHFGVVRHGDTSLPTKLPSPSRLFSPSLSLQLIAEVNKPKNKPKLKGATNT